MTNFSTGIDIVEIDRIRRLLEGSEKQRDEIFSPIEVEYCMKKKKNQLQHFSARFAAKEAVLKALGTGILTGFKLKDIEVENDGSGKPGINLYGKVKAAADSRGVREILVSLSHSSEYAVASVILISRE
jgi:holo-[acyl-carrier protein] synthase